MAHTQLFEGNGKEGGEEYGLNSKRNAKYHQISEQTIHTGLNSLCR